jgi:hypothetical protein
MSKSSRKLRSFHLALRRELAAQFRVDPDHPGIERILEETEAHLEDTIAELVEGGATDEAATTTALSRFGTASRVARAYGALQAPSFIDPHAPHVDVPQWRRLLTRGRKMSTLSQWFSDVRIAVRGLLKSPAYLLAFILTLGLGIGANTAIFSVIHGIWLRSLPYRDGDRLVYLRHSASLAGVDNALFSVPEISSQRVNAALVGAFAFLALTVAAVGVAGVLAFGVSQRTHEFGVRAALGASRSLLMRVVLKEGALLALFGLALGLAASLFFAELVSGMLYDVAPTDVATLGLVALTLILVALLASAVPAWRASEIDPVQALREE